MPAQSRLDDEAAERFDADLQGIRLRVEPEFAGLAVDVEFGSHRVWSFSTAAESGVQRFDWPSALAPHVRGTGDISLRRSSDRELIARRPVTIETDAPRSITDEHGRWMAINKWGHLGLPLDGRDAGFQRRLLDRTHELIRFLEAEGFEPFVCSGTLLGAIRSGGFLPHDDDVDLGFVTRASHPTDVNLVSFRMQRGLEAAGYHVVRHSGAHLQITFLFDDGAADHYIDIFTGYFDDLAYNQPFAMRGTIAPTVVQPLTTVLLEGERFPAPADPAAMLELNYGPGWRVPDPAYSFAIPRATTRRFEAWYGSFNHGRDHWEAEHSHDARPVPTDVAMLRSVGDAPFVVDLGAGRSGLAATLAARGVQAIAVDYSLEALARQSHHGVDARYRNLGDRRDALELAADILEVGLEPTLVLDRIIEWIRPEARDNLELLLRGALVSGGRALVRIGRGIPDEPSPFMPGAEEWIAGLDPATWFVESDEDIITLRRAPRRTEQR